VWVRPVATNVVSGDLQQQTLGGKPVLVWWEGVITHTGATSSGAVKVVDDLDEAIRHIRRHGSGLAEAIVTKDLRQARRFTREVDAAAVLVNASTRLVDGNQFGMGAEMGISTSRLHARGPVGLEALTTTKFVVQGDGQVRE